MSNIKLNSEKILDYQVCTSGIKKIIKSVDQWINDDERSCKYFACLNPHAAVIASEDNIFKESLQNANFVTADGIGVVYASRILKGQIRKRVTGMDVFIGINEAIEARGQKHKISCFFLGSTEETLSKIQVEMTKRYPNVHIAGTYSPPYKPIFSEEDNNKMIQLINESAPDILWIGLTAPKQEKWVYENRSKLRVNFVGPIGAAFDFFAGNIQRVGSFWQDLGFEWLPRLLQEPRRLWRRSLISAPKFFWRVFLSKRS